MELELRDGRFLRLVPAKILYWPWREGESNKYGDIVAYRVLK